MAGQVLQEEAVVTGVTTAPAPPSTDDAVRVASRPERDLRFWAMVGRHRPFAIVFALGVLLRLTAVLGYRPAMWFNDSFDYLHAAMSPYPHPLRPDGYSFFLLILKPFHSFALVVSIQHLMGVAMGLMIYAVLRRRFRLPGWGATLATVPVLLDSYEIQLEHLVLSDLLFTFLIVSAITLLLWYPQPSVKIGLSVGLILGMAALTRSVGLPVLIAFVLFMLVRRVRWRVIVATVALCALPMAAYAGWFYSWYGKIGLTQSSGLFLYARASVFADCNKIPNLPVEDIPFCKNEPLRYSQSVLWDQESPLHRVWGPRFGPDQDRRAGDYAKRAILAQPGDYLKTIGIDFLRSFQWNRTVFPDRATFELYNFGTQEKPLPSWNMGHGATASHEAVQYEQGSARTKIVEPFGGILRAYQKYVFLRGSLLGVILLIGLAGMVPLWRKFGGAALLPWMTSVGLLLAPAATAEFDYRYVLPTVPLACLAAALAFAPEVRDRYSRRPSRKAAPDPHPSSQVSS
jgi:Dolichyl-phosphate-mannose--protein O-mannosyl transferase